MEHNHLYATGGFESKMKFSPQLVESPPPKPPRRRFSDQHSPSYLGNNQTKMSCEIKGESKSKRFIGKPAYLSLPASLTASLSNEYDDPYNIYSHASDPSDYYKISKEKEIYRKCFLESSKCCDCFKKKVCQCNRFCDKKKIKPVCQDSNSDKLLKNECGSFMPFVVDKLYKNSGKDEFVPSTVVNHCQKSVHKNCHRRHSDPIIYHHDYFSDPALFCINFLKDSALKFDWEHCCNRMSHSAKKSYKLDFSDKCSCCKRNYSIVQEIKNLKEINEKLWQRLCSMQIFLENRKKRMNDEYTDVSISDLLSSIYYAQKAKDTAVEERLRIALEERDAALQEIDDLIHAFSRSSIYSDNEKEFVEDKKNILGEGCEESLPGFLKHQRMLLAQIKSFKDFNPDSLSYQLTLVTNERNNALEKVKQLEEDIKSMQTCFDLWHSDNKHWEITMLDVLDQIIHQRDTVLSKIDNRLDIDNIKYRYDAMQQNISSIEPRSKTVESLKTHQSLSDCKQPHSFKTDEVRKLKEEIFLLNKALEGERKRREQSEKKCVKLERLIHVLRKKLNGQDVGVHV